MMSTRRGFSSAAKEFGNGFAAYEVALRTVFGQQGVGLADRLVVQRHGVSVVGEVPRHVGAHHRGAGDADLSGAVVVWNQTSSCDAFLFVVAQLFVEQSASR